MSTEAEHQRQRWGSENDAGKEPEDWFWLIGYLAGKAVRAAREGNREKYEHHIITAAAALKNWHAQLFGQSDMRPGIQPPTGVGITRTNSPAQGATEEDPRPRDCSGDPESCPDNEGCGCWCSDRANSKESGQ